MSQVSPDSYLFSPTGQNSYYGVIVSNELIDFLLNEFKVTSYETVNSDEISKMIQNLDSKTWGNVELLT